MIDLERPPAEPLQTLPVQSRLATLERLARDLMRRVTHLEKAHEAPRS